MLKTLRWRTRIGLGVCLLAGCLAAVPAAETTLTEQEREASFPADLGPATIDVSSYPAYQQQSYTLFTHACSVCHSPARAINSPVVSYEKWSQYVQLMHLRARENLVTTEDAKQIVDFLAFDSKRRKVDNKKAFQQLQAQLNTQFAAIQKAKKKPQP